MVEQADKVEKVKVRSEFGFGVNNCPLWLFKKFSEDAKARYNDVYWVRLLDLERKAEAYDLFVQAGIIVMPEQEQQKSVEKDDTEGVLTFSGRVK